MGATTNSTFDDVPNLLATTSNSFFAFSITRYQPLPAAFPNRVVDDISAPLKSIDRVIIVINLSVCCGGCGVLTATLFDPVARFSKSGWT